MASGNVLQVVEVVTRDCVYGFSGYAKLSDGTSGFPTTRLHASQAEAAAEVSELARIHQEGNSRD